MGDNVLGMSYHKPAAKAAMWQEARKLYRLDRCDLADSTVEAYFESLDRFFAGHADIKQVGKMHLLQWLQQFGHWSTYNFNLAAFKSFFAWASEFYQFEDPSKRLKTRKQDTLDDARFITEPEYAKIKAYAGLGRDIAVYLANTGLRAAEFLGGRPEHIQGRILTVFGKGRKTRKVPLNETAWQILEKYHFAIHLKKNGQFMSYTNLRYRMEHLAECLGLEPFGPHSLRHYLPRR